uniref:Putative methyltransferase n=1 Tax=viral metagenome TaxID=1070528 RepID=A0A6M3ING2_9ZZZZ
MPTNDYFYTTDPHIATLDGFPIPSSWWSRPYEYAWAILSTYPSAIAADMGSGYVYRPFTDALSATCQEVYAIDNRKQVTAVKRKRPDKVTTIVADFTTPTPLAISSLDLIFCISVLEDVGEKIPLALAEFRRLIAPDGLIVLTFDVPIRDNPIWPGVNLTTFWNDVAAQGLHPVGAPNLTPTSDLLLHEEFGLTCYHAVLSKKLP